MSESLKTRLSGLDILNTQRALGPLFNQQVVLQGSAVYDAANLIDAAGVTTTITVAGAALGDFAMVSCSVDLASITTTAWVSAANTVSVRLQNESAGAVDLASATFYARVFPNNSYIVA